ncbi:MAG TPA: glycosyltransferase family 4 protein [Symbiobacteriaceae bacterium]|jgi:glycosyltransferase involved in cell wall biosynthesis|nr:glycosyltransferase family 4 protein [Symbiobacteriaceae bacterium]
MARARVIVCNTMDPFVTGGSELFATRLTEELNRAGHEALLVTFPFRLRRFEVEGLVRATTPWRALDLTGSADVVIPLRYPTWLTEHPHQLVYLNHQLRTAYELFDTPHGPRATERALAARQYVVECDAELGRAQKIFAVSRNVQHRLKHFNGLESEVLYHSLPLEGQHHPGSTGNFVLSVGRLVAMKRFDLLIRAVAAAKSAVRCLIVGEGRERSRLEQLIADLQIEDRVKLLGWVSTAELIELYAGALGVFYAPVDEDYGLVTLEAFHSAKPVLTAMDSGGTLEFVQDGINGRVLPPDPVAFAEAIDQWYHDRSLATRLGLNGAGSVQHISWERCVNTLAEHF